MDYREDQIIKLRSSGATLQEIGNQFGITRERVRQILAKNPVAPDWKFARSARVAKVVASQERNLEQAKLQLNLQWKRYQRLDPDEAAHTLGVSKKELMTIISKAQAATILGNSIAHAKEVQWTDLQCISALKKAARLATPLSHTKYDELRQAGKFEGPSAILLLKRYGTWLSACKTAGIQGGKAARANYESKWSDAVLMQYLVSYLNKTSIEKWSLNNFDKHISKVSQAPSLGVFRNRLGSWYEMLALSAPYL